jgi:hypothetical protein
MTQRGVAVECALRYNATRGVVTLDTCVRVCHTVGGDPAAARIPAGHEIARQVVAGILIRVAAQRAPQSNLPSSTSDRLSAANAEGNRGGVRMATATAVG